ncbi:MAG: methyltransferase domain-containing protein [Hyphomonadaceae bacterium]|nr:methyltransferase domain-containing protein [Hyphomonadaceae bacterium]
MNFEKQLEALGPFWERIDFPNGISTGPGRAKAGLWKEYIGSYFQDGIFKDKSILDIGCNAGGNLIELSKFNPKKLVGVDYSDKYCQQAKFVCEQFDLDVEIVQYSFDGVKSSSEIAQDLGKFDFIFCLGVIYHQKFNAVYEMLKYIHNNSERSFYSTQTKDIGNNRTHIDWEISEEGTKKIFQQIGYSEINDIYRKSSTDNWESLTNDWYFEAKH